MERVDLETIKAWVDRLDWLDQLAEIFVVVDLRPADVAGPFVDLGGLRRGGPPYGDPPAVLAPAAGVAVGDRKLGQHAAGATPDALSRACAYHARDTPRGID